MPIDVTIHTLLDEGELDVTGNPCTVLCAKVLARYSGMGHTFKPGTPWWRGMNIVDHEDTYSNVRCAAHLASRVTGGISEYMVLTYDNGPTWKRVKQFLKRGRRYLVQGWRSNGTGHCFLIEVNERDKSAGSVWESSTSKGLRKNRGPWGDDLLDEVYLPDLFEGYDAGLGLAELW